MFSFCTDPSTLDTFRWFSCYLTNGAHFLFYQSFLTVFALLAVTVAKVFLVDLAAAPTVTRIVAFLASDAASFITGQNVCVNGWMTVA